MHNNTKTHPTIWQKHQYIKQSTTRQFQPKSTNTCRLLYWNKNPSISNRHQTDPYTHTRHKIEFKQSNIKKLNRETKYKTAVAAFPTNTKSITKNQNKNTYKLKTTISNHPYQQNRWKINEQETPNSTKNQRK